MRYYELTAEQLEDLSSGLGGGSTIGELFGSRVSISLLLLRDLVNRQFPQSDLDDAIALLERVQAADPDVYADLFGDPLVGAWLTRALRVDPLTEEHVRQFGGLAVAGALRAGVAGRAAAYVSDGRVHVPTVGVAEVDGMPDGPIVLTVEPGLAAPVLPSGEPLRWRPSRFLRAGAVSVRLEDLSPFRDGYHAPPSPRLSAAEAADWQELFAETWSLLTRYVPERAAELAVGLRAIVPLIDQGDGSSRSGTARESVGALGMTRSSSAADFLITLVHEFQHSKLSAVLDLVPLYRRDGSERHRAPWRTDPRPTSGLIQGVYAFLSVADTWHRLRAAPDLAVPAERQFARLRDEVRIGLESLEGSAELTAAGEVFVRGLRLRLDQMLAEPIGASSGERLSGIRRPT